MLQQLALPLLALAYHVSALALPQTGSDAPLFPSNTTATFFQGFASAPGLVVDVCGVSVAQDMIQQGTCTTLLTAGIGLQQTETGSCSFTLYSGSAGCDPGPDGTNAVTQVIGIPNGDGTTCIGTGVLDGGKFDKASGIWVCG